MRDLLNKLQLLTEATGLAGRKAGDPFQNDAGEIITFNNIKFFPEQGGRYNSEQLDAALQQTSELVVHWQNARTAKVGGFALANFDTTSGPVIIGRFLNDVKADPRLNLIDNKFVINGEIWKFASSAAKKEQSGLSPLNLLSDRNSLTIAKIMNQLSKSLGVDHPLYEVAHKVAIGTPLPFTFPAPEGIPLSAFRDYFGEILQPIALQKGQFEGNAMEAANRFLDGSFEGTVITFGETKTGGLTDSVITSSGGKTLLVSSKGGKGAEASAKNLYDEVQKLKTNATGQKFLEKYKKEVQLLDDMVDAGMHGAPLRLAVDEKLINEKEADQVRALRPLPKIDIANIGGLNLTSRLISMAKGRDTDTPESVNIYYHLIAAIAHKVADHVNKTTNFPRAAADILNNGALVQVYTKVKEGKNQWTLDKFYTVYPGEAIKGVFLSAGKNYYSTDIKGNFTFLIDKGQGIKSIKADQEKEPDKKSTSATTPTAVPNVVTGKRVNIRPKRGEPDNTNIGREKR
jgi:hypothetical protein